MPLAPSQFRTQNQILLVKKEATAGVDAVPALTDAVLCEAPTVDPNIETADNPELTGAFDVNGSFFTGAFAPGSTRVRIKGPGSSPGVTRPDWSALLEACSMPATDLSAAVSGTLAAAAANSATLAVGASAVDNFYRGMVLLVTGFKPRIITSYVGSTKVATVFPKWAVTYGDGTVGTIPGTVAYSIPPGTLFSPASTAIPSLTWKRYFRNNISGNATLDTVLGWRGSVAFSVARTACTMDFRGQGDFSPQLDAAYPGTPNFLNTNYPIGNNGIFAVDDAIVRGMVTMDLGVALSSEEDFNAPYGRSGTAQTRRRDTGTLRLPRDLVANRDVVGSIVAGTEHVISVLWGTTAGNRCAFLIPRAVYIGSPTNTDVEGVDHLTIPIQTNGADVVCFLYIY